MFPTSTTTIPFDCPTCGCGECAQIAVLCMCCGNFSFSHGTETDFYNAKLSCPECGVLWNAHSSDCSDPVESVNMLQPIYENDVYYRAVSKWTGKYEIWPYLEYVWENSSGSQCTDHCGNVYERGDTE